MSEKEDIRKTNVLKFRRLYVGVKRQRARQQDCDSQRRSETGVCCQGQVRRQRIHLGRRWGMITNNPEERRPSHNRLDEYYRIVLEQLWPRFVQKRIYNEGFLSPKTFSCRKFPVATSEIASEVLRACFWLEAYVLRFDGVRRFHQWSRRLDSLT